MNLDVLGWNEELENASHSTTCETFGRISFQTKQLYRVISRHGEVQAHMSGNLLYHCRTAEDFPTVGDWVCLDKTSSEHNGVITGLLPRKSLFVRKVVGNGDQLLAANVDVAFIVMSLTNDFNLRRLERYMVMVHNSGARPVILLSKSDLSEKSVELAEGVRVSLPNTPVHLVSSVNQEGIAELRKYMGTGQTVVMLGSSGVGKSTLINTLYGSEIQKTGNVRDGDGKGKHTTTSRQLVILPSGGLVIDTPGLRELQLPGSTDGLATLFDDIQALERQCKFTNCQHQGEPGCAIAAALLSGELLTDRWESYKKLMREVQYEIRRENHDEELKQRREWKNYAKELRKRRRR